MADGDDTLNGGASNTDAPVTMAHLDRLAAQIAAIAKPAEPAAAPAAPAAPPRVYTRAELNALVEEGKITQDAADAQIEKQITDRVTSTVTERVSGQQLTQTVQAQIDGYFTKHADLNDKTSPAYKRVEATFNDLVRNGSPKTVATELAALKIAYPAGDLGPGERDRGGSPEIGGGAPPRTRRPAERDDEAPSDLSAREKQHYQHQIDRGVMSGWKQVREERAHRRASVRVA